MEFLFGVLILLICMCICFISSWFISSWFSLVFFLVYIGGILVLIFYTLILKRKPKIKNLSFLFFSFLSLIFSFLYFWFLPKNFFIKNWEIIGLDLWYFKEINFILGILSLLLIVLWIISKLKFKSKRAFRPLY